MIGIQSGQFTHDFGDSIAKQADCLYRVSNVQQLHEDDIPMQRQACWEFAAARGWKITKEFYEKGISGFKTPTADRRVLQQIKKDAKQHEFDILLIFMFDRLGRWDSETPFFVEDSPCWALRFGVPERDSRDLRAMPIS